MVKPPVPETEGERKARELAERQRDNEARLKMLEAQSRVYRRR